MGSRTTTTAHRLSSGLLVSGPPERPKEKPAPTSSAAAPYTGIDASDAALPSPRPAKKSSSSSFSGPLLPATGLITSGPTSGSSSTRRSGALAGDQSGGGTPRKLVKKKRSSYGPAVTSVGTGREYGFAVSAPVVLAVLLVLVLTATLGVFLMIAVKSIVVLACAGTMVATTAGLAWWNRARRDAGLESFLREFPDTDLYGARNDNFVKITGVVTCGSIPLETSYQGIPRCAFTSTELREYRVLNGKQANPAHKRLTWGVRHLERHVADFYVSDNRRGVRALVKAGHGAKIISFVKPTYKLSINRGNIEMHPTFSQWLDDSDLSFDDRIMHLEEGYIKEGSIVTVMGILQQHDNILMIVPPEKPVATGFIWRKLLLPMHIRGLVLIGDKNPNDDVVTV